MSTLLWMAGAWGHDSVLLQFSCQVMSMSTHELEGTASHHVCHHSLSMYEGGSSPTRPPRTVTMIWQPKHMPRMRCCLSKAVRNSFCSLRFQSSWAYASRLLPVTQMPCRETAIGLLHIQVALNPVYACPHLETFQLLISWKMAVDWVEDLPLLVCIDVRKQVLVQLAIISKPVNCQQTRSCQHNSTAL